MAGKFSGFFRKLPLENKSDGIDRLDIPAGLRQNLPLNFRLGTEVPHRYVTYRNRSPFRWVNETQKGTLKFRNCFSQVTTVMS